MSLRWRPLSTHLIVLVRGVLVHPVRVEHTQTAQTLASALLGLALEVAHELELVDTLVLGLTVHDTLAVGALAATTAHGHTVHHVALQHTHT
jgi:hypothetical protein